MATSSKVEIPEGARKEVELCFMHQIAQMVETHNIPPSLVLNLDQTPTKYVPSARHTLAQRNSKSVVIAGSSDKRTIMATFTITLDGTGFELVYRFAVRF